MLTKDGVTAVSLSRNDKDRHIKDASGKMWILHSLQKCDYLKTHQSNHLLFQY